MTGNPLKQFLLLLLLLLFYPK